MDENKFRIKIDDVEREAELLKTVVVDDKNYAIYSVDNGDETSDILASQIIKNEDGSMMLVDLETDDERSKLKDIVTAMFS